MLLHGIHQSSLNQYVSEDVQALWDIPTYGENHELQANRIDAKLVNHKRKEVVVEVEKSVKYGPLRRELQERYPGYTVHQYNIIMDVLGGWSKTEVAGKKDKRCATKHAEVSSVKYVEYCKDV